MPSVSRPLARPLITLALLYRLLVILLFVAPLIDAMSIAPSVLYLYFQRFSEFGRKNTLYFFIVLVYDKVNSSRKKDFRTYVG